MELKDIFDKPRQSLHNVINARSDQFFLALWVN